MARKRCTCSARKWDPECEVHETRSEWRQDDELHEEEEAERGRESSGPAFTFGHSTEIPWEELSDRQKREAKLRGFGPEEDEQEDDKNGDDGKKPPAPREKAPRQGGYFRQKEREE